MLILNNDRRDGARLPSWMLPVIMPTLCGESANVRVGGSTPPPWWQAGSAMEPKFGKPTTCCG